MVSGVDAGQFLGLGKGVNQRFEFSGGTKLVARSADEELWFGARSQELEIVDAIVFTIGDSDGGQAEGNERADSIVVIRGSQSDGGSEGKTGKDYGKLEFLFQPVEGGAHIFDFSHAVGVLAFTQSGAAEVEAEHGESEAVEGLHGVEDDFVVERSSVQRMRMTDEGGVGRGGGSGVEEGFKAACGACNGEGADGGNFGRHGIKGTTTGGRSA